MKVCKLFICKEPTLYHSVHENVPESLLHSVSAYNNTTFTFWSTVNRPLSTILQIGDIYRIFHELQHSLARLQHRYFDITILMGW